MNDSTSLTRGPAHGTTALADRRRTDGTADQEPYVPEDVLTWVHEQIARGCTLLTLRQRADEGELLVCNMPLPGPGAHVVATALYSRALSEGRFLRGPTLFAVYAFRDVAREHCDRKTFRVEGETFMRSGETEPPTLQGVNSMLMRHAEGATKIALGHTSHIIEQYKVLLGQAHRRIAELEATVRDAASMRESLVMLEHERALAVHRAKLDEKRGDFVRDKLDLLLPVVAGKVLGNKGSPVPPVVTDEILRQLLGSFTPEQIAKLQGILAPDQQVVIGDLYMRYAARSKDPAVAAAAREAAQRAQQGTGDGAAAEHVPPPPPTAR